MEKTIQDVNNLKIDDFLRLSEGELRVLRAVIVKQSQELQSEIRRKTNEQKTMDTLSDVFQLRINELKTNHP